MNYEYKIIICPDIANYQLIRTDACRSGWKHFKLIDCSVSGGLPKNNYYLMIVRRLKIIKIKKKDVI